MTETFVREATGQPADVVQLLLANKADVNARDNLGRTTVQLVKEDGDKDVVELLRRHGGHE